VMTNMSFWKITSDNKPEQVSTTKLKNEQILEKHLEDWIENSTDILGEPLLIIGRQIIIPEVKERLDLLALDPSGNAVIIELKRGRMSAPVDMQSLRYASYISKWEFSDFEHHAKSYLGESDEEFNFNEKFETFCTNSGIEEIPDINTNQRMIIVGSEVKDKLGSVALWLYERNIDIKIIEIDSYKEGDQLLIQPRIIIPHTVNRFSEVGKATKNNTTKPWKTGGKTWHLEKRMNSRIKQIYLQLDDLIRDNFEVDAPDFSNKLFITYQIHGMNWFSLYSGSKYLALKIRIKPNSMKKVDIAKQLEIEVFDTDDTLSEKLNLPSSVNIRSLNSQSDRIILRLKDDFKVSNPQFLDFLKETLKNMVKSK